MAWTCRRELLPGPTPRKAHSRSVCARARAGSRKGGPQPALAFWLGCSNGTQAEAVEAAASGVVPRAMQLHKVAPRLWDSLRLQRGILARLPPHYLRALREDAAAPPTAVHWRPPAGEYARRPGPLEGVRQQVVPVPVYFPPESQEGLWGGEGCVVGYRYAHDDKVGPRPCAWGKLGMLAPLPGEGGRGPPARHLPASISFLGAFSCRGG